MGPGSLKTCSLKMRQPGLRNGPRCLHLIVPVRTAGVLELWRSVLVWDTRVSNSCRKGHTLRLTGFPHALGSPSSTPFERPSPSLSISERLCPLVARRLEVISKAVEHPPRQQRAHAPHQASSAPCFRSESAPGSADARGSQEPSSSSSSS